MNWYLVTQENGRKTNLSRRNYSNGSIDLKTMSKTRRVKSVVSPMNPDIYWSQTTSLKDGLRATPHPTEEPATTVLTASLGM